MNRSYLNLMLLTLLSTATFNVKAQLIPIDPNHKQTQIRAVIIGVSKYADSLNFENLKFADKDAEAYATFLKSEAGGSVPEKNITLLRNGEATRTRIIEAMSEIYGPAQAEDILIFFFSGHGESTGFSGTGLLCPSDIQKKSLNATGFKMNELDEMFSSKAKIKMTLIDACHAGTFKKNEPGQLERIKSSQKIKKNADINSSLQKYLNNAPEGNLSILSCEGIQESREFDHLKHGVFTYYLLRGLQGEADKFLKESKDDGDGKITIRELYGYIHEGVARTTSNQQIPILNKSLPGETVIAKCDPSIIILKPIDSKILTDFNKIDPDSSHRYARRWLEDEKPAINFKCPTDTSSAMQILEFTFTNPTIEKDVEFIHIEINRYTGKIKGSEYYTLYHQVFKPQAGLNRFIVENHMNEKNIEIQIGYALKKKAGESTYHYYHASCFSTNTNR